MTTGSKAIRETQILHIICRCRSRSLRDRKAFSFGSKLFRYHSQIKSIIVSSFDRSCFTRPASTLCQSKREFALLFLATNALDFLANEVPQAFEIDQAVSFGTHDEITPDSSGTKRVVDLELEWSVKTNHALHDLIWRWIVVAGERNANAEPPSKWSTIGKRLLEIGVIGDDGSIRKGEPGPLLAEVDEY